MRLKYLVLIFFILCFQEEGFSQARATFTASVTIVEPLKLTTLTQMDFAEIDATKGGKVTLTPTGKRWSQGFVKIEESMEGSAASFLIEGNSGLTLTVDLPKGHYFLWNEDERISISDFRSSWGPVYQLKEGENILKVGASLSIPADQKPGRYTTLEPLEISVHYN